MKRIVLFLMSTLTIVVLLFGYHTSTSSKAAGGETAFVSTVKPGSTSGTTSTTSSTTSTTSPTTSTTSTTSTAAAQTTTTTLTGDVTDTRWGPVQVQLTVAGGKITAVAVLQYPNGNGRDQQINANALPILVQETLSAQSAEIDMVSGATVTSDGYLGSLQSALDKR